MHQRMFLLRFALVSSTVVVVIWVFLCGVVRVFANLIVVTKKIYAFIIVLSSLCSILELGGFFLFV